MSIVKSKHASNFTTIHNDTLKEGLSLEAIGLLMHFLSLPHDWVIYKTQVHKQLNIGKDKLDRVFKELQKAGYILSVKEQRKDGIFEYQHIVYDKPYNGEPPSGKPCMAEPCVENPQLLNKEELNKQNKENINVDFDDFIESFNIIVGKNYKPIEKVKSAFSARIKQGYTSVQMLEALEKAVIDVYHIDTKFKYLTPEFITRQDKLDKWLNS